MPRGAETGYDKEIKKNLSRRLKAGAYEAGMNLTELQQRTGVPRNTIYSISTQRTSCTVANLCRIADGLGCSVDWLLGRTDKKGERHGND